MERWPELSPAAWSDTQATLHLWTQIVGKIRLKLEPMANHWWNVTLYVTARGLSTSPMPYGERSIAIDFDFIDHELRVTGCDGERAGFALEPMTVATFYARTMEALRSIGVTVTIYAKPNEIVDRIPFETDTTHASYDREAVERFWRVLLQVDRLSKQFRAEFLGKSSPSHFFWGSFDLATTRFSGRVAPPHPGGFPNMPDWATREAYSHEEHSVGFWPGAPGIEPVFYAYFYPEPAGFAQAAVRPEFASWNTQLNEFTMPYAAVRSSSDPDRAVLDFFESTYAAGASLAGWDPALLRSNRT